MLARGSAQSPWRDQGGAPLHRQIRDHLLREIEAERLQPGDRLPTEKALAERFSVSRITAQRALNDIAAMGLAERQPGRGSFVKALRIEQDLTALTGFVEDMKALGLSATAKVVLVEITTASADVADHLGIALGDRIFHIQRVRLANGQPISLDVSYLPEDIGSAVTEENLEDRPFYSILEDTLGVPLGHGEYILESMEADGPTATHLGVPVKSPILRIERTAFARSDDRPLIYEFLHYRGDRVRYRLNLQRTQPII
jgi:GntR family transcriptional regulator